MSQKSTAFKDKLESDIQFDQNTAKSEQVFLREFYNLLNFSQEDFKNAFKRSHVIELESYRICFNDPYREYLLIKTSQSQVDLIFTIELTENIKTHIKKVSTVARIETLNLSKKETSEKPTRSEIPLKEKHQQELLAEMTKYIEQSEDPTEPVAENGKATPAPDFII